MASFFDFLNGEREIERQTLEQYKIEFEICIKLWEFLLNDLIKSVDGNCILFMYFKHQVDMSLRNAITSLMRLQTAQSKQNLRFALENIALCMYYLNEFEEFNEIYVGAEDRKLDKITNKLKEKAYKLIETKYPEINK